MAWPDGDAAPSASPTGSRFRDLTVRTATGIVMGLVGLAAIIAGPYGVVILAGVVVGGVVAEWHRLSRRNLPDAWVAGGWAYLAVACFSFFYVYFFPFFEISVDYARDSLLWLLAVVIANDTLAYGVGRWIGGPKLAPRISPKKTWSGAIGGLAGAGLAGGIGGWAFGGDAAILAPVGVALAILAQLGDLAESLTKRRVGVKDAGSLIPGHGGFLDRFDGLFAASIGLALAQILAGDIALRWE
ncbi:MAG: phosphatidate cytidylyltransferase [Alphaproteobacteria bacterium]